MSKRTRCPQCKQSGTLRKILYGYPIGEPDESKYILGGCVVLIGRDFDSGCIKCGWEGFSTRAKEQAYEELNKWMAEREEKEKATKTD